MFDFSLAPKLSEEECQLLAYHIWLYRMGHHDALKAIRGKSPNIVRDMWVSLNSGYFVFIDVYPYP